MDSREIQNPTWYHDGFDAGSDLFQDLREFFDEKKLSRAYVISTIGSLQKITCNYPESFALPPVVKSKTVEKPLEINGMAGELWRENGTIRIHIHGSATAEADILYGGGIADGAKVLVRVEMVIMGIQEK